MAIATAPSGGSVEISARILLDAAGRKGCLPARRVSVSPPTLAWWTHVDVPAGWQDSQTRVEANPEGWIWAAPVGAEGRLSLLLFCDPERRVAPEQADAMLRKRLAASTLFSGCARATLSGPVSALDATNSYALDTVGADFVKIREAAYSLDPLSSTGVEKAIQSAVVGATVAYTLLDHPDRADSCARFYRECQQEAVVQHSAWPGRHYFEVNRYAERPFWLLRRERLIEPASVPLAAPVVDSPPSLGTTVRLAPEVRFSPEPCIVGNRIEMRDALGWPAQACPLIFLDGIEVAALPGGEYQAAIWCEPLSRWSKLLPPVRAEQLAVRLWRRGVLRPESHVNAR